MTTEFRALATSADESDTSGVKPPYAPKSAVQADDHVVATHSRESSAKFALGLLAMYVRDMAMKHRSPPPKLLKGSDKKVNVVALAHEMQEFLGDRTDRPKSSEADKVSGASVESLRKVLSDAMKHFADSVAPVDTEATPAEGRQPGDVQP